MRVGPRGLPARVSRPRAAQGARLDAACLAHRPEDREIRAAPQLRCCPDHGCGRHGLPASAQRLMLMRSWRISSDAVIMRELAWNPRWAMIRLVNSWARSTFDISS